jgi:hypothetical protein
VRPVTDPDVMAEAPRRGPPGWVKVVAWVVTVLTLGAVSTAVVVGTGRRSEALEDRRAAEAELGETRATEEQERSRLDRAEQRESRLRSRLGSCDSRLRNQVTRWNRVIDELNVLLDANNPDTSALIPGIEDGLRRALKDVRRCGAP